MKKKPDVEPHRCRFAQWIAFRIDLAELLCCECGRKLQSSFAAPSYNVIDLARRFPYTGLS